MSKSGNPAVAAAQKAQERARIAKDSRRARIRTSVALGVILALVGTLVVVPVFLLG